MKNKKILGNLHGLEIGVGPPRPKLRESKKDGAAQQIAPLG